ncbi:MULTISPECIES: hypothetical protein [Staphylococcus]|uniref:Uncharacterized protein n=1 Tax=Staphylococcus hsinchuensis TaxID=3051183 RepID=A0ABZ3E9F9_9STAP|nr:MULTISPECIES: hypothetical protein [unclassified Staphylococcus]
MSLAEIVMLLLTVTVVLFIIIFNLILDKSLKYTIIAMIVHSILLFLIRVFWAGHSVTSSIMKSFDILEVIAIVVVAVVFFKKRKT